MDAETLTREEALLAINDHLGETVRVEMYAERGSPPHSLLEMSGALSRVDTLQGAAMADVAERDYMTGAYMIGVHSVHLGFLAAEITWSAYGGIEFHLARRPGAGPYLGGLEFGDLAAADRRPRGEHQPVAGGVHQTGGAEIGDRVGGEERVADLEGQLRKRPRPLVGRVGQQVKDGGLALVAVWLGRQRLA
jgi:hypothetical protein